MQQLISTDLKSNSFTARARARSGIEFKFSRLLASKTKLLKKFKKKEHLCFELKANKIDLHTRYARIVQEFDFISLK